MVDMTRRMQRDPNTPTRAGGMPAPRVPTRVAALAIMLSVSVTAQSAALPDDDYAALARAAIDQVIIPAWAEHARAAQGLAPAIERHCTGSAEADAAAVRAAFDGAMDAWQRASPFAFGPVMHGAGRARIAFWPGRPGSAARQMRAALRARDESLLDPARLAGKSVAIKDLQALEHLLFEVPRDAFTCGFAEAIAHYQAGLATAILDAWTGEGGFRHAALAAGGDSDEYADDSEVARDLMRALTEGLETIIAQKLERPLGENAVKAKPKRAESWRSGRSLRNVVLNLESLRALVETRGGFGDLVTAHGHAALATRLRDGFAAVASNAGEITPPLRDAVSEPGEREKVHVLLESVRTLRALVTGPLSRATGILVGFNSQDGD